MVNPTGIRGNFSPPSFYFDAETKTRWIIIKRNTKPTRCKNTHTHIFERTQCGGLSHEFLRAHQRLLEFLSLNWQSPSWKKMASLHSKSLQLQHSKNSCQELKERESLLSNDGAVDPLKAIANCISFGTEVEVQLGKRLQASIVRQTDSKMAMQWTFIYQLTSRLRVLLQSAPSKKLLFEYSASSQDRSVGLFAQLFVGDSH